MDLIARKKLYSCLDITSLSCTDSSLTISDWVASILTAKETGFSPAALCVFPVFVKQVATSLKSTSIKTAAVAAGFPDSQTFLSVKIAECKEVVQHGADEVDVVLNLNAFFQENYAEVVAEIQQLKSAIQPAQLKVIIETGVLTLQQVKRATELAIQGGADFVKTSTGRVAEGATLAKVEVMCEVLKKNPSVGLKISGGIRTIEQAQSFYKVIKKHMGASFMVPSTFRIGASSLAEALRNG